MIVMLISLSVKIHLEGNNYDCDKCNVVLTWWHRYGPEEQQVKLELRIPVQDIYEKFIDGKCSLMWDQNSGYVYEGEVGERKNG